MALDQRPNGYLRSAPEPARRYNVFVPISNTARVLVVAYVIVWRILPEIAAALQFDTDAWGIVAGRLAVRIVLDFLLLLPILRPQFAGTPIGWIHPLVLPLLMSIAKDILTNPLVLLSAVTPWLAAPELPPYDIVRGLPLEAFLALELKTDALLLLSQAALLVGFSAYSRRARSSGPDLPTDASVCRILLISMVCFSAFIYLMWVSGGLRAHFSALAFGRFLMAESAGHLIVLISVWPYILALLYVARPRVLRQSWFIALLGTSLLVQFMTTGSRSSLFIPIALIIAAWILLNGKVPSLRIAVFAVLVSLSFGALADLRGSAARNHGIVDFSVLADFDVLTGLERTIEHREKFVAVSGQIATMHAVPETIPHLYGATYVSAIASFIPRTIWPDKPRGAGAHVGAIIYLGMDDTAEYTGTAYPPGGMAEAYWNFGVPGVAAIYFAFGLFIRLVAQSFLRRPHDPQRVVFLLLTIIFLAEPTSDLFVRFVQMATLLFLAWIFVRRPVKGGSYIGSEFAKASVH